MAKRKSKAELEITSIENKDIKEIIDNKESKENTNDNKTTNENKENYIITKKSEGVYIRKLRRL